MKWRRKDEISNEQVVELSEKLNINPIIARIVLNRGFGYEDARIILNDIHEGIIDPELLTNAEKVAEVIYNYCIDPLAMIWIFGDYDADGLTSVKIMKSALEEVAECEVNAYYPERTEGYGLNMNFCERLVKDLDRPTLVITVDNGVTKVDEIEYLQSHGITVVVTDHHMAKDKTPNCLIVDPHNFNEPDTFKHLAGCGVAFKVAQLVQRKFNVYNMMKYTPYVAIGTLADMMPLTTENIVYVQYGLSIINSEDCPLGLKTFKKYIGKEKITATDIAWELAPRLNACGRMGNIQLATKLFFENEKTIEDDMVQIDKMNILRKKYSDEAKKAINKMNFDNDKICIINATGFPEGIVGIMAGKAVEKFGKPAIVLTEHNGKLSGSARSINGLALQEIFQVEMDKGNIAHFGGHDAAAGLSLDLDKIEMLKDSLNDCLPEINETEQVEVELVIDELINLEHINGATFDMINVLPYDSRTFRAPIFALLDVEVISVKTSAKNPHNICFKIKDGNKTMEIWAWGMTPLYDEQGKPQRLHIAGQIEKDFRNPRNFAFKVIDFIGA
jgi:single-stranded-DNA-specific exonuclease